MNRIFPRNYMSRADVMEREALAAEALAQGLFPASERYARFLELCRLTPSGCWNYPSRHLPCPEPQDAA